MLEQTSRIIDAMIQSTWLKDREGERARPGFVITISRECGSEGEEIAHRVAKALNLPCFNKQLVEEIAREASVDPDVFHNLEEKVSGLKPSWLETVFTNQPWLQVKYLDHLLSVLLGISRIGGVVVGRGAHLLLGSKTRLRVRVVAPFDLRVERYAKRQGVDRKTARQQVKAVDEERNNFIKTLFHKKLRRAEDFDLIINTERISVEAAANGILNILHSLPTEQARSDSEARS